ncbi:MAG: hypothetical protein KBT28_01675 [Bacteroidales bacterium]|nr:hypothetical protein [Candidatus Colimorpha merdihippi]
MPEALKASISAIVLIVANVGLYFFGTAIDTEVLTTIISGVAIAIFTAYAAWKNHNFTKAAQVGQLATDMVKLEDKKDKIEAAEEVAND